MGGRLDICGNTLGGSSWSKSDLGVNGDAGMNGEDGKKERIVGKNGPHYVLLI